jgi:hypothetical protein
MLLRKVTGPQGVIPDAARQLLQFHPLVISSFVEDSWRNSQEYDSPLRAAAWPAAMTARIREDFGADGFDAAYPSRTGWDHLIYAYLIENTRIFDIFAKVVETCCSCEDLGRLSPESRVFARTTQDLIFSDPPPTTIWNVTGRAYPDEISQRMAAYRSMLGIELNHAAAITAAHRFAKPADSNVDFIETFEALAGMLWRGFVNVHNFAGPNDTDNQAIVNAARRLSCMFAARREGCIFAREELRAVAVMSWLHLAVSFNSPIVIDLQAQASCPEERLYGIARRVGLPADPRSQALFALAQPFSKLLTLIENGGLDNAELAQGLYTCEDGRSLLGSVIGNYSIAMGHDVKALPVTVTERVQPLIPLSSRRTTRLLHHQMHG